MKVIGVTGSFGSGKTFVSSIFASLGAKVCDADELARAAVRKPSTAYRKIVKAFGNGVLGKRQEIDRRALADIVFNDKPSLKRLNDIIHPEVIKKIKRVLNSAKKDAIIVIDAPLLIEAGLGRMVDVLVVVAAPKDVQITRCRKKLGIKREDALARMRNQMAIADKVRIADFVVDNSGTKSETKKQVKKIWGIVYGNS